MVPARSAVLAVELHVCSCADAASRLGCDTIDVALQSNNELAQHGDHDGTTAIT